MEECTGFVDDLLAVVVAHELPKSLHAVSIKLWIGTDDGNTLRQGLRDEQAIEGVIVVGLYPLPFQGKETDISSGCATISRRG